MTATLCQSLGVDYNGLLDTTTGVCFAFEKTNEKSWLDASTQVKRPVETVTKLQGMLHIASMLIGPEARQSVRLAAAHSGWPEDWQWWTQLRSLISPPPAGSQGSTASTSEPRRPPHSPVLPSLRSRPHITEIIPLLYDGAIGPLLRFELTTTKPTAKRSNHYSTAPGGNCGYSRYINRVLTSLKAKGFREHPASVRM